MKSLFRIAPVSFCLFAGLYQSSAQMTVVNGASFAGTQPIAPGSFATAFGHDLCPNTVVGDWIAPGQLPAVLGGCSVMVNGSPAMLQYMSPGQVNFILPAGVASGPATVMINNGMQMMSGNAQIGAAGPGMFALSGMGMGEGAMLNGMTWRLGPFSTTTGSQPTYVSVYVTGLDLTTNPMVTIGGMPANVTWFGDAPGYAGLQQINIELPSGMAGVGRAPVMVTSSGQISNVTFMHILPTTAMMQGMPGWGQGMMMGENMPRGHEMSALAVNPTNNTVLVTDENDDVVRVISTASNSTVATITLPSGSQAHGIALNGAGTLAAVTLSAKASVALIDLTANKVVSVIGTGNYPSRAVFAGANILVTNSASGTVSVIDSSTRSITQTVSAGLGASGIAVTAAGAAIVANMQAGSLSIINLTSYTVSTVALPAGSRPYEVAVSDQANKAIITTPMSNGFLLLDLATNAVTQIGTAAYGMGPRAVAISGGTAYITNQMTASVSVADLGSATVLKTFPVDPGPIALAPGAGRNQLFVLSEGTGTLDVIDLGSYAMTARLNAGDTERQGQFTMPLVSSITPATAPAGTNFNLTIAGSGFQSVQNLEFRLSTSAGAGGGMMGGGMGGMGGGFGQADANIKVSNLQVNASGTQITAAIQVLPAAAAGTRQIRLETSYSEVMGPMTNSLFTVTK